MVEGGYLAAALRFGGYRRRIVAVEHGAILQGYGMRWHWRVLRALDRLSGARAVDIRVAVSDYVARRLRSGGRPVVIIPNAVDLDVYRPLPSDAATPPRQFVIGCMGRLVPGKGFGDVLVAAREVLRKGARLRVAGDGPERPSLEKRSRELGLTQSVEFLGWVADAAAFWATCDVAVVPSHQSIESFGLTAVEAMASGRPVVATRNGGLPEVVAHNATGFLVEPGSTDAMAEALRRYFHDRNLLRVHGEAARVRCERSFDIARCAESYLALFSEAEPV